MRRRSKWHANAKSFCWTKEAGSAAIPPARWNKILRYNADSTVVSSRPAFDRGRVSG